MNGQYLVWWQDVDGPHCHRFRSEHDALVYLSGWRKAGGLVLEHADNVWQVS